MVRIRSWSIGCLSHNWTPPSSRQVVYIILSPFSFFSSSQCQRSQNFLLSEIQLPISLKLEKKSFQSLYQEVSFPLVSSDLSVRWSSILETLDISISTKLVVSFKVPSPLSFPLCTSSQGKVSPESDCILCFVFSIICSHFFAKPFPWLPVCKKISLSLISFVSLRWVITKRKA